MMIGSVLGEVLNLPPFSLLVLECNDSQVRSGSSPKWRMAPTRREQDKWDKATKAATSGSVCYAHNLS